MARMYQWRKSNPIKTSLHKRRETIRKKLRERGYLPPVGIEMTQQQKIIDQQISNDDYTFWDNVKLNGGIGKLHNGGTQIKQQYIKKSNEQLLLERAKQSAKEKKLDFNLTIEDIIIPEYCPLLEVKLSFDYTTESRDTYYSVDRINSDLGYIKGNVQVLSLKANTMKNNANKQELLIFSKNIIKLNS